MRRITLPLLLAFSVVACGPSAEEQAEAAAAAAAAEQDSLMTEAQTAYDTSVFDTLTWETPERRGEYGPVVYLRSCEKCHGPQGLGDGGFVMGTDTLQPPSFREPTWAMAGDVDAIREAIFLGNREGMPHWGLVGLSAGAVDAVTQYILDGLGSN